MQSRSNSKQVSQDDITVLEKIVILLVTKVNIYNNKLYIEKFKKSITLLTYLEILKKGSIQSIDANRKMLTVHIDLQKLKTFRSKVIRHVAAYGLLKDSTKLEVLFIINIDGTLSVHRRLIGLKNETI